MAATSRRFAANLNLAEDHTYTDSQNPSGAMGLNLLSACDLPYVPIYQIQGSGLSAAVTGSVTTRGVVVGDYEGPMPNLRGFYI
jgi:predicted extracellular nuclease